MAATFVAVACGSTSSGGSASKGTIKIGSDLPVCTVGGQSTANGVQFAVNQRNSSGGVNGYTIAYQSFDDCVQGSYSADAGVQNVQTMLGDPKFLGMVGPYNSAVAEAEIPIAAAQHFVMVSPANTNPCLTKEVTPPIPACTFHAADLRNGNPNNYWRVVTTDDYQGPSMADYYFKTLNITKVGVLDDSTVYGVGIAGAFKAEFQKIGGTVVGSAEYQKTQTSDWRSILLNFKNAGAQAVYAGGTDDQNICIPRKQMKDLGWDVPYAGGDGMETTNCIDEAAGNEVGMYSTSAGADATKVPAAAATIAAFRAAFPGANDFGGYTMQAYDAANALMDAIGRAVSDANGSMPSREQVRAEMAKTTNFKGVIGTYNFDQNGDTTLKIVSIFVVESVTDPTQSTGVCGSVQKDLCFVWKTQVNYATS
jgi:branched-chain amino acid transport system substrate-binding protein